MAINPSILERLAANDSTLVGLNLTQQVDSDADVEVLVHVLKHNTHFRKLTIQGQFDGKGITDRSAELLASCNYLVFLDISGNKNITDAGAAMLATNLSIETLYMRGCSVTPEGLDPFLENQVVTDLRIAITPARSEQVSESIQLKLEANKSRPRQKRERLSVDELNDEVYRFIQANPAAIKKLKQLVRELASEDFRGQEDSITTALTLCNHLSKLTGEVAEKAAEYAQQYRALREAQQAQLSLHSQAKKRKEDSVPPSLSLSPTI